MDTRSKILTLAGALELRPPVAIVTGLFDVLRAEDARELRQIRNRTGGQTLLVVVLPLANELLAQRARAELVAALRVVDYVVTADDGDVERLTESLKPAELARLEGEHAVRARQLREHVHRR